MKRVTKTRTNTLAGVANALHRAAYDARLTAIRTATPLVLSRHGKLEKRRITEGDLPTIRKAFKDYLKSGADDKKSRG